MFYENTQKGGEYSEILNETSYLQSPITRSLCIVKPVYDALEGTSPRERYRRESVIRGK